VPLQRPAPGDGPPDAVRRLRRVGETCLWLLIIGVTIYVVATVAARLRLIALPVLLALVLTTLLAPPTGFLRRRGWPDGLAALVVVVTSILTLGGLFALLAPRAIDEFGEFDVNLTGGLEEVQNWLVDGPLGLSDSEITEGLDRLQQEVGANVDALTQGAVTGAFLVFEVLAGLALALVVLFFFLKDGDRIWAWLCGLAPPEHRDAVREAGSRSWTALAGFLRGQTIVAAFDAVFIGLALVIVGVPLVLPLVALTFFGAYVPILGAFAAGRAACLVALFAEGPVAALIILAAIVVVQQVESNVLQPFVVGRTVRVHPVAVLLSVTAGGVLAGIIGAMVATPVLAVFGALLRFARERTPEAQAAGEEEDEEGGGPDEPAAVVPDRRPRSRRA
jgi:putative heme transporter